MAAEPAVPETRVLAIASHVVYGYVGNKMATFVMQSLGCDVSSINTVNYSNHTAYKQVKGTKTTPEQINELYEGLKQSSLNTFDVLLTGYMPSADNVEIVGKIARDLKFNATTKPGSFFWVLDPVMGDNGKLYIPEDEVPQYKSLLREADLILPNQFEAELLSDTQITDLSSLATAIQVLHRTYLVPHIIITSLVLNSKNQTVSSRTPSRATSKANSATATPTDSPHLNPSSAAEKVLPEDEEPTTLTIIGSTATSDHKPRLFRIDIPKLPLFFSGTGDMFAALTVPRLIEAVHASSTSDLHSVTSWKSPDDVPADELPLAKACQKVLASMQSILAKTLERCETEMKAYDERAKKERWGDEENDKTDREMKRHLALTKASEVRVVRCIKDLVDPQELEKFRPRRVEEGEKVAEDVGRRKADDLEVVHLGVGGTGEGAISVVGQDQKVGDMKAQGEKPVDRKIEEYTPEHKKEKEQNEEEDKAKDAKEEEEEEESVETKEANEKVEGQE